MAPTRDENGQFPAWAWPGGYPLVYLTRDGGTLCPDCANGKNGSEATDATDCADPGWQLVAVDVNYEDAALVCDHCGKKIDAAYAD